MSQRMCCGHPWRYTPLRCTFDTLLQEAEMLLFDDTTAVQTARLTADGRRLTAAP